MDDFDQCYLAPTIKHKSGKKPKYELAPELIEWMAERTAFIYPELLPTSALKPSLNEKDDKPYFAKAEDNLIALGKCSQYIGDNFDLQFSFLIP